MSETRKKQLTIDGGKVKEDDNVSSYKPVPDIDAEFPTSKSNLTKSKEKISADGAEEKLLSKEEEVKIIPARVDMDAKYVVESYTNGDAKIELDANKKQFAGLTKEELMKYADDPKWVRLRWSLFILFWALWVCMLIGAIVIIVGAPKCPPPPPKTWYQRGPHVDLPSLSSYNQLDDKLPLMKQADIQSVFAKPCKETYEVKPSCLEEFKEFVTKAKGAGVRVIVDLVANFVSTSHEWFTASANRTEPYDKYFVWANATYDSDGNRQPPNNWLSVYNDSAWSWHEGRKQFYLHQFHKNQADLNFTNSAVVSEFENVIKKWMQAGASGIRLQHARQLLVDSSLESEIINPDMPIGVTHHEYAFLIHSKTSDLMGLNYLFAKWATLVDESSGNPGNNETMFTSVEDGIPGNDLMLLRPNSTSFPMFASLPMFASSPISVDRDPSVVIADIADRLDQWPLVQLISSSAEISEQIVPFALLLPAAPVFQPSQLYSEGNQSTLNEAFKSLSSLRRDASIEHGKHIVEALLTTTNGTSVFFCIRWKIGHTGYIATYNPSEQYEWVDVDALSSVPPIVTLHYVSQSWRNNYTDTTLPSNSVKVPPKSSIVLSYVPENTQTS